uniref:Uncharacterized protein n=1 Tax=Manihot esculenta TaxID=3983 RepID=A0A2C9VRY3_MANES
MGGSASCSFMSLQGLGLITGQEYDHDSCAMEANTWVSRMLLCEPKRVWSGESKSIFNCTCYFDS